ncbi:hypothetical protein G6L37_04595 [Agrobacterium rubi]|nr:hypothetical protein [Agrobacterium rubi]NTF24632.1 hypothetical protein [Agrobacterium rubi]
MTDLGNENLRDGETAKRRATNMKARLKGLGHDIPISHVYELLATSCGYRNWPTMNAALSSSSVRSASGATAEEEFTPDRPTFVNDNGDPVQLPPSGRWGFELVLGPPGKGKTSFSQAVDLKRIEQSLDATGLFLPHMIFIDIEGSTRAFIERAREMVPKKTRHLVKQVRLRTDRSQSINILDTPLGLRKPPAAQRQLIVNFIMSISEISADDPQFDLATEAIMMALDAAYTELAGLTPGSKPNLYVKGISNELDRDIAKLLPPSANTSTWWGIADAFFEAGHRSHAVVAQRFAVPHLGDLCRVGFGVDHPHGEIAEHLAFRITRHIDRFPIRSEVTDIPPVHARILSVDLSDFAQRRGQEATLDVDRAFLLARQTFCARQFFPAHDEKIVPRLYARDYVGKWVYPERGQQELLVYDDINRLSVDGSAIRQIETDIDQANKRSVNIRVSAQALWIIPETLAGQAMRIYMLGVGKREIDRLVSSFGLSSEWLKSCVHRLSGPDRSGLPFSISERRPQGTPPRFATLVMGSEGIWAASMNPDDIVIRDAVAEEVGIVAARKVLAKRFPSGSAYAEIETRLLSRNVSGLPAEIVHEMRSHVVATIATEIASLSAD